MADPFIGEIRPFAFTFPPRGWAECNGQLLPIAQNTALFSLLGTTYGGDGRTTFALPDLRDRAPVHAGRGPGLTDRQQGQAGGVDEVTLTTAQAPSHGHAVTALTGPANTNDPADAAPATAPTVRQYHAPDQPVAMAPASIAPTGGSQPHPNLQPGLPIRYCIALQGVFPSRD